MRIGFAKGFCRSSEVQGREDARGNSEFGIMCHGLLGEGVLDIGEAAANPFFPFFPFFFLFWRWTTVK